MKSDFIGVHRTDVMNNDKLVRAYFTLAHYEVDNEKLDKLSKTLATEYELHPEEMYGNALMFRFASDTKAICTPLDVPDIVNGVEALHQILFPEMADEESFVSRFYLISPTEALKDKIGELYCVDDYLLRHHEGKHHQQRCEIDFIDYLCNTYFEADDVMLQAMMDGAVSPSITDEHDKLAIKAIDFDFFDGNVDVSAFGQLQATYESYLVDLEARNYHSKHNVDYFHAFANKFFCDQYRIDNKPQTNKD